MPPFFLLHIFMQVIGVLREPGGLDYTGEFGQAEVPEHSDLVQVTTLKSHGYILCHSEMVDILQYSVSGCHQLCWGAGREGGGRGDVVTPWGGPALPHAWTRGEVRQI